MSLKSIVISIGNELLLGRTVNSNLSFLGAELSRLGIPVLRAICVQDEAAEIMLALGEAWQDADVVITTGGLGPTEDDITREVLAGFFGRELKYDEALWEGIRAMFMQRKLGAPPSNKVQAMVPEGFSVLHNARGTAPGLHFSESGKHFFALQGVPLEMKGIFTTQIEPILKEAFAESNAILQRDFHTYGIGESALAEILHRDDLPVGLTLAWLPQTGRVDLRIYGSNPKALAEAERVILRKAGKYIWGMDHDDPARCLVALLKKLRFRIAIAESCTGGLLQKYITDVPGVSEVFWGGVVSYDNSVKEKILGVSPAIIEAHGAVSRECAQAMAEGVQRVFDSEVAISVTGIAGPDGGSSEKPVGTVYFAFRIGEQGFAKHLLLFGDRESIRHKAAEAAILLLFNALREDKG
jgi:nicotinamide-nucleotide amidase